MQKKVNISIVIVNYKVADELFNCVDSIINSSPKIDYEIIVVDNDEKDVLKKDLKKRFPKVRYIKSNKNIGYGGGNNLGVKEALGEYILILNPDTRFTNNVVDKLYNFLRKNKKAGAVSPLLLKENGEVYPQGSMRLTPLMSIFSISFFHKIFPNNPISKKFWQKGWNYKTIKETGVIPGTAFMISKNLFIKAGGFDEKYFLYFEENDLSIRINKMGYKLFINPDAKIIHKLGASTKKNYQSSEYFKKSRFYYFKKNYGLIEAIPTEIILRTNKYLISLFLILLLAFFLRTYRLSELMHFIGDQGWFYVSARDMLLTGEIPLVGITSSHIWLHQGAYWTYILAVLFKIFNFNPFVPGYFIAITDTLTIILLYIFASKLFSRKTALFSSLFYATSPAVVLAARMPYHTSLIPLFTTLLLFSVYKWINGKVIYFPISIFLLAVLYNMEIATFSLGGIIILLSLFGYVKKKKWFLGIINKKIILLSLIFGLIPMIPMIIYDIGHGFPQTIKVVIWIFYRLAVFLGYPPLNPNAPGETWTTFFIFLQDLIRKFIFYPSKEISIAIVTVGLLFLLYKIFYERKRKSYIFIFLFVMIPVAGYIAAKTNSAAYTLIVFPQLMIMLGILFGSNIKKKFVNSGIIAMVVVIGFVNTILLFSSNFETNSAFSKKIEEAKQIISKANGRQFNIVGKGEGSQYESFTTPFEYLTWWLGQAPSKEEVDLKFYLNGDNDRIEFETE